MPTDSTAFQRVVWLVAILNLAYFGVEFAAAWVIGSVSLFADSIDFLEDALVNFLILLALTWTAHRRAKIGMLLAGILLLPTLGFLWALWGKWSQPIPPEAVGLSLTGLGAIAVNFSCAVMLARYRAHHGSLARAAFLSARNDVLANVAIIAAGIVTVFWFSIWPDVVVGLGIATINMDAVREVFAAAKQEHMNAVA